MKAERKFYLRVKSYFKRLGFWRALGLRTHKFLGQFLNPHVEFVWGSLGEDTLIWHTITEILNMRSGGYYVDVGCNDPVLHSNTYKLYQNGWQGLAIDANPSLVDRFAQVRPMDIALCELISDDPKKRDFTIFDASLLSTVDPEYIKGWDSELAVDAVISMQPKTLGAILDSQNVPKNFELLKVDVEGHELQVLRSLDFDIYRPIVIVAEMESRNVESLANDPVYLFLASRGYSMLSLAGYNGIFVRGKSIS